MSLPVGQGLATAGGIAAVGLAKRAYNVHVIGASTPRTGPGPGTIGRKFMFDGHAIGHQSMPDTLAIGRARLCLRSLAMLLEQISLSLSCHGHASIGRVCGVCSALPSALPSTLALASALALPSALA